MTRANGRKRRVQAKYGPLTVGGDDGYSVRLNPPIKTYADLMSGLLDRIIPALVVLVREHPLLGEEGDEPLPVEEWPLDDVTAFVEAYGALMTALPPDSPPPR